MRQPRAVSSRPHIAANRDYVMYQTLQREFEPIRLPHFVADTDGPLPDVISATLEYLRAPVSH